MEIQFIRDYTDPDNPEVHYRKGERIHRKTSVCDNYIEKKLAEKVRYASYVEKFKSLASAPKIVHAADNSVAAPTLKVGWSIVTRDGPGGQHYFVQQVTAAGETFLYDGPPSSAPATVVKQWQKFNGGDVDPAVAAEARRVAECERKNAELANKELETKNYHRIFGGK